MIEIELLNPVIKDDTPEYEGPYTVEPSSQSSVVVPVQGKKMTQDLTVERATLEELNVTVTENGERRIEAEEGYLGLSGVNLTVDIAKYPNKGDIVNIDMDGDGINEEYLVLKQVSNSVVELLKRSPIATIPFTTQNNSNYFGGYADNYLNYTYYNTLSEQAKSSLIEKTISQKRYYRNSNSGSPLYYGCQGENTEYKISVYNSYTQTYQRKIYSLSIEEVLSFLRTTEDMRLNNTTLTSPAIRYLFNTSLFVPPNNNVWLRDSLETGRNGMTCYGIFPTEAITFQGIQGNNYVIPAFQIDLSKITWSLA